MTYNSVPDLYGSSALLDYHNYVERAGTKDAPNLDGGPPGVIHRQQAGPHNVRLSLALG